MDHSTANSVVMNEAFFSSRNSTNLWSRPPTTRSLKPRVRRRARYSSSAVGNSLMLHLPAMAAPLYATRPNRPWRISPWYRMSMPQNLANFSQGGSPAEHTCRQRMPQQMSALESRIQTGARESTTDDIIDSPGARKSLMGG